MNEFGLTPEEWEDLVDVALTDEKTDDYHRRYQLCVRYLRNQIKEKSKTQLDMRGQPYVFKLHYDSTPPPEGKPMPAMIVSCIGNTFSGKTFFINEFLCSDLNKDPRHVYLFSAVRGDDSSLEPLRKKLQKNERDIRFTKFDLSDYSDDNPVLDYLHLEDFEIGKCVLLFDDAGSLTKKNPYREAVIDLLNFSMERIRHTKNILVCSNHLRSDYSRTKKINNSSRIIVLFPRSNKKMILDMLVKDLGMHIVKARILFKELKATGRSCCFHRHHPSFIMTDKLLMLT